MQSQTTELQVFAGGLHMLPASHLIAQEEAKYIANVNLRKRNLTPFLLPLFMETAKDSYVYNYQSKFVYYSTFRSNVLYNGIWYWTSLLGSGKVYKDGTELPLGISPPILRPEIVAHDPIGGADGLTGNISYVYTYYDPKSGSESPPSKPSITLDLTGINAKQAISITELVQSPNDYEIRLYRIGGIITAYSAVTTLSNGVFEFTDQLSFTEIQGMLLDTFRAFPPPSGLIYLTEHQGRFFGAVNEQLVYSPVGKPDSWYALDFIGFEKVITGIASTANGLVVMTNDKSWVITGNRPHLFVKQLLSESEGCKSFQSIATNEGTAIWLSNSGIVTSNGGKLVNLSINKLGRFNGIEPFGAAFVDKRYFMSFGSELYPSELLFPSNRLYPATSIDGNWFLPPGALVVDFSMGNPSFSTLLDEGLSQLLVHNNMLHQLSYEVPESQNLITENTINNIVTESGFFNITAQKDTGVTLSQTLEGGELRELTYVSPLLTEGSIGTLKQYEKIRVMFRGDIVIKIEDENNEEMQTEAFSSAKLISVWVGIPVGQNRAHGIQFKITGNCIVNSIMYNWTPKEAQ